jgi:hypothetical protein
MHELTKDGATLFVHRIRHAAPTLHLPSIAQARYEQVALTVIAGIGAFGDDQSGSGALPVVQNVLLCWHAVGGGTVAGHWRHDDAIAQGDGADFQGVKQDTFC